MSKEISREQFIQKKTWKPDELEDLLLDQGWILQHAKHSRSPHHKFKHPTKDVIVEIPLNKHEVTPGVKNAIKNALWSRDQRPKSTE